MSWHSSGKINIINLDFQEQQTSDPFVIYNPIYGNIRAQLTDTVYGMEVEEMQNTLGVCCDNYNAVVSITYLFFNTEINY